MKKTEKTAKRMPELEAHAIYRKCPRFLKCVANVCGLDPLHDLRDQVPGDRSCIMVLHMMKGKEGKQAVKDALTEEQYLALKERLPELLKRHPLLMTTAESARKSGITLGVNRFA